MGFSNTILQRGYVQKEAAWGTVPNDAGTATLAGADAFLFTDLSIQDQQSIESRPDKTGSYSRVVGLPTLRSGTWSVRASLAGGGAADVPPDLGPYFEALLGKQTIAAGASVTYDPDDIDASLSIWDYNRPATAEQRVAPGSIVQRFVLNFGQTFADCEFSGENKCVLAKSRIATGSTEEKSGLTAFPDEPATPVTVGNAITGRKGIITLDGQAYSSLRTGTIEVTVDRELKKDTFNNDLPTGIMGGARQVRCNLTLDDDDGANQAAMVAKAYAKTAVNFTIQLGTTAGGIFIASLKNILLPNPTYDYSGKRRGIVYNGCETAATSLTSKDEVQFQFK